MIKKLCPVCNKVIERKYPLCPECTVKMTSKRNKAYNSVLRNKDHDAVYTDTRWSKVKPLVHIRDNDWCRLCFRNKALKNLQMVHYIIEPEINMSLAYDPNNLISLCESCHQKVHAVYRDGNKDEMVAELQRIIKEPMII